MISDFRTAREILRSGKVRQAGAGASQMDLSRPEDISLFYIDGDVHRRRRGTIAPYFTPKAIETRYRPVMERAADKLLTCLSMKGEARLDRIAFLYAVAVAAEIIGLNHRDLEGLSGRIEAMVSPGDTSRPTKDFADEAVRLFNETDVMPAVQWRRQQRCDDVISRLIDAGASDALIRTEVRGYAIAGMMTTREFVVVAAWYLLDSLSLAGRFRLGDDGERLAILDEIIRLEPPVGVVKRLVIEDLSTTTFGIIPAGTVVAIDLRAANVDEAATGKCPFAVDPARRSGAAPGNGFMSFGDGGHRCPGAQLAMHEAMVFLELLLARPGITLSRAPNVAWFKPISSYELTDARVTCTPVVAGRGTDRPC